MEINVVATLYCIAVYLANICEAQVPLLDRCCLKWSDKQVAVGNLISYHYQSTPCAIDAIRFVTVKEKLICSNPDSPWTKHAKSVIDERRRKTTSTTTSTTPTPTSTTPPSTTPTSTTPTTTTPVSTTPSTTIPSSTTPCTTIPTSMTPSSTTPTTNTTSKTLAIMIPSTMTPTPMITNITNTITSRSTVRHTRKIRWIKHRKNRGKKPLLRQKIKNSNKDH